MFVEYANELLQYKKNALNMHIYLLNMKVSFLNVNEYRVLNNATNKQPYTKRYKSISRPDAGLIFRIHNTGG